MRDHEEQEEIEPLARVGDDQREPGGGEEQVVQKEGRDRGPDRRDGPESGAHRHDGKEIDRRGIGDVERAALEERYEQRGHAERDDRHATDGNRPAGRGAGCPQVRTGRDPRGDLRGQAHMMMVGRLVTWAGVCAGSRRSMALSGPGQAATSAVGGGPVRAS